MTSRDLEHEFDTFKEDLAKMRTDISNLASAARDSASSTFRDVKGQARDKFEKVASQARDQGEQGLDALTEVIEDRPLTALLVAFGVGLLFGRLLDR